MKLSIVIAAYNRPEPLARLLKSVDAATTPTGVKLIKSVLVDTISFDGIKQSHDKAWIYGNHVGLKQHLIRCLDYGVQDVAACVLLEDDLFVSPYYLHWAKAALDEFDNDLRVAAISLFSPNFNEYTGLPFIPIHDGFDNYFLQVPSSFGVIWTDCNWTQFKNFYAKNPEVPSDAYLPEMVKSWPETSLKKHIAHYLVVSGKTVVYPRISFATNFGDPGTHLGSLTHKFQVPLCGGVGFSFGENPFYDSFYEPRVILGDELVLFDTLRLKQDVRAAKIISCCDIANPIKSWGLRMLPIEANVIHDIPGDDMHLGYGEQFEKPTWKTRQKLISYYSRLSAQTPDLVYNWRKRVEQCQRWSDAGDREQYNQGRAEAFGMCADELARTPRIE